jgi:pimeloyl-ACP methyl ester carboxylesterase
VTTLVLVPGLLSDCRVWLPLSKSVGKKMAVHHAVLAGYDSLTAMAEHLLEVTSGPIIAVGHSMGGRVCMEMARLDSERVVGLVLADTGYDGLRGGESAKRQAMVDLGHESMPELVDNWLPPMVNPARHQEVDLMEDLRQMALQFDATTHESWIRALINRPDAGAYLHTIHCPVLLMTGDLDNWSPISQHQEMAAIVPNSEFFVIEDAGHFAPIERPHVVCSRVDEWLDRRFQ